eukprot:TRINITY_DN12617_c2_g4_i1.p1 TRINITY_DN12617_c2_g4~~TRINITY_DN12617_c2_g4_i1.p1  ORF type:complete len:581 (+),score=166.04 TRINITY_DN12617_c2_g4_i1:217-1959(+)
MKSLIILLAAIAMHFMSAAHAKSCGSDDDCAATEYCGCGNSMVITEDGSTPGLCQPRKAVGDSCGAFSLCPAQCQRDLNCHTKPSSPLEPQLADAGGVCCTPLACSCPSNQQPVYDSNNCPTCDCVPDPCGGYNNVLTNDDVERFPGPLRCDTHQDCPSTSQCDTEHSLCCRATPVANNNNDPEVAPPAMAAEASDNDESSLPVASTVPSSSDSDSKVDIATTAAAERENMAMADTTFAETDGEDYEDDTASPNGDADHYGDLDDEDYKDFATTPTVPLEDDSNADNSEASSANDVSTADTTRAGSMLVGGWKAIDTNDQRALSAMETALVQDKEWTLTSVLELHVQVVAGLKYRAKVHVHDAATAQHLSTIVDVYVRPGHVHGELISAEEPLTLTTTAIDADDERIAQCVQAVREMVRDQLPADWSISVQQVTDSALVLAADDEEPAEATAVVTVRYTAPCSQEEACTPGAATSTQGVFRVAKLLRNNPDGNVHMTLVSGVRPDVAVAESNLPDESHLGDGLQQQQHDHRRDVTMLYLVAGLVGLAVVTIGVMWRRAGQQQRNNRYRLVSQDFPPRSHQ